MIRSTRFSLVALALGAALLLSGCMGPHRAHGGGCGKPCACKCAMECPKAEAAK
ncbi:MAG: hypothetical protein ACYDAI_06965 [Trichloromonadaceae bacterium]